MWLRRCAIAAVVVALVACDDDDPVGPTTGNVEVEVLTTGEGTDSNGFTVDLDNGAETEAVTVNDTITITDVDAGSHTVELTDLASNCSVDGDNPKSVTIQASETETVSFAVTCTAGS